MPFDLPDHLAMMSRRVTSGERDGQTTAVINASRVYPTDATDLWDALTQPERLSRWFLPISGDLRQGGRYQFKGNAGGSIEVCEPPKTIGATWEYGGGVSWVTVRLTQEGGGTRMELEHEAVVEPYFMGHYGPGAVGVGWDQGFMGLARHLEDPSVFPASPDVDGWEKSAEALAFFRTTSLAWGQAAAESGTPVDEAMVAAERTRAFYSGEAAGAMGGEAGEGGGSSS